jgi:ABC-type lipoprotein export system ATPase subunit
MLALQKLVEVGLESRVKNYPSQLSGGEQQRVAIARALVGKPNLILADEPTGNLDTVTSEEIMKLLIKIHEQGKTIIMITHNKELTQYATRVVKIKDGKLMQEVN